MCQTCSKCWGKKLWNINEIAKQLSWNIQHWKKKLESQRKLYIWKKNWGNSIGYFNHPPSNQTSQNPATCWSFIHYMWFNNYELELSCWNTSWIMFHLLAVGELLSNYFTSLGHKILTCHHEVTNTTCS